MIKQVIVIRRDLKMRRGKECVQASHASMQWLIDRILGPKQEKYGNRPPFTLDELEWMAGDRTKICLQIDSREELVSIYEQVRSANIICSLITDLGFTEFHGQETMTAIAIGPDQADKIDPITSHLKLY